MKLPVKLKHIMILTGEPSGDFHASNLVKQIKKTNSNIYFSGIGGNCLKQQNVDIFYDIANLSAMGFVEVLLQLPKINKAFYLFKLKLKTNKPDLIVFVDYPGFNLKAAAFAKKNYKIKTMYYITPKVWAWNKARLKKIKNNIDFSALIFPFEENLYKNAGIKSVFVGNPLVEKYPEHLSKPYLRLNQPFKKDTITIGLLPGSRISEIKKMLDTMIKAALLINEKRKKTCFIISQADSIDFKIIENIVKKNSNNKLFKIQKGNIKNVLFDSDLVIAASGTVTLETALCCVPTIVVYKMSFVTYLLAKLLVRIKYVGLANLIVNNEVMPELIQSQASPEKIRDKALDMLDRIVFFENKLSNIRKLLSKKEASKNAANIAIDMLR